MHGSTAKQTKAKAEREQTLAHLMQENPRHPWQVVLDATHVADSLMREHKARIDQGDSSSPEDIARLMDATKLAHHLAKTAIDTRAHEHLANQQQRYNELEGDLVASAIKGVLDSLVTGLNFGPVEHIQMYDWALQAAHAILAEQEPPAFPLTDVRVVRDAARELPEATSAVSTRDEEDAPSQDDSEAKEADVVGLAGDEPSSETADGDETEQPERPQALRRRRTQPRGPAGWGTRRSESPMGQVIDPWAG